MIKRIRFVTRRSDLPSTELRAAWTQAVARTMNAPPDVRPVRAVSCVTLRDLSGTELPHDAIGMEWFADLPALVRFEAWLASDHGRRTACVADVVEREPTVVVIATEVVMRGAEWLERRWAERGPRFKHMALARRAGTLSPAEFSARWRGHAGTIGGAGSAPLITIPDRAKGNAYVQNHPLERAEQWRYDAINEVYFDDRDALQSRVDFFCAQDVARASAELVSAATFVAAVEDVC